MSAEPDRPGLLRRLRTWIGGTPQPDEGPPREYVADLRTFQTPSKGDAFDFDVTVRCAWSDGRRRVETVRSRAEEYAGLVEERIAVKIRCVLRSFPPHQAAEAETCLNNELAVLAEEGLPDTTMRWSARVQVGLHTDVQTLQQEAWKRALQQGALHEFSQQIVKNYTEMAQRWRRLLAELGVDDLDQRGQQVPPPYLARYLIRLAAEPISAADIVDDLARRREEMDADLLSVVAQSVQNAQNVDINLLEFEMAQNSALSRLMQWVGLPVAGWSAQPDAGAGR